jgi:Transposase DDE domain group 1
VNVTVWSQGLEVSGDGTGIVSHAGIGLLRHLADKTGLTRGLSAALATGRLVHHDRGRVLADVACAIADGARGFSDFRVLADQSGLFGQVASVPTVYRTLEEIAKGGDPAAGKLAAAVNTARRFAWSQTVARHGKLPGVRIADKTVEGVTCIRLDATVTFAHSDKELAQANFKGFGHHPLLAFCDNTGGEPLAWMLREGSAGSNTTADHVLMVNSAIAALPPPFRRRLMVTADGAGASHGLIEHLDKLAARRGYELTYSVGWVLTEREKAAIRLVPEQAWEIAVDGRGEVRERRADGACAAMDCGEPACWIEEAHVIELTGLLRSGPGGDQLATWPATMRVFARRERPHPGAKLSLFENEDGWRYTLWVTNLPEKTMGWRGRTLGGNEGVVVDEGLDMRVPGGGVGDDRPAVGMTGQDDRSRDGGQEAGQAGGVVGQAAQRVGRRVDGVPVALQAPRRSSWRHRPRSRARARSWAWRRRRCRRPQRGWLRA